MAMFDIEGNSIDHEEAYRRASICVNLISGLTYNVRPAHGCRLHRDLPTRDLRTVYSVTVDHGVQGALHQMAARKATAL
jgi:hypothetical protein